MENRSAPDFKGLNANYHDGGRLEFRAPSWTGKAQKSFRASEKGRLDASRHSRLPARGLGRWRGSTY